MRETGLRGVSRRRGIVTTRRDPKHHPAHDLVRRNFHADRPDQLWVADITLDVYVEPDRRRVSVPRHRPRRLVAPFGAALEPVARSRLRIGWAMANTLHASIVLTALEMATAGRKPRDVIHHSDKGSQYTSLAFGQRCAELGVRPSTGSVGDAYDNAMAEAFFATLECELLDRRRFASQAEARMAVFHFIEGFYNPSRRHSALGYLSPMQFERGDTRQPRPEPFPATLQGVHGRGATPQMPSCPPSLSPQPSPSGSMSPMPELHELSKIKE